MPVASLGFESDVALLGVAPNLKVGAADAEAAGDAVLADESVCDDCPKVKGCGFVTEAALPEDAGGKAANGLEDFDTSMTGVDSGAGEADSLLKEKLGAG